MSGTMRVSVGSTEPLFVAELEPPPHALEEVTRAGSEGDIRLLAGKRNRVAVQRPSISQVAGAQLLGVALTVGCLPDPDCRFTWLQTDVELDGAVARALYPERDEDEVKVVKSFDVSLEGGVTIAGIGGPSAKAGRGGETEFTSYRYHVVTFGRGGSKPIWHFRATDVHPEIAGDFTLILLVEPSDGGEGTASVSVSAEAQLRTGLPKLPLLMKRTAAGAAVNTFELRPDS